MRDAFMKSIFTTRPTPRRTLLIGLLILNVWSLHGLDMQFYTLQDPYLFDMNLYIAVMTILCIGVFCGN